MRYQGMAMLGLQAALVSVAPRAADAEDLFSKLYEFTGKPDASTPLGPIAMDHAGNIYGASYAGGQSGYGSVFEVSPPQNGATAWSEAVLYSFSGGKDGENPNGITRGRNGVLYGIGAFGGAPSGCGTVFDLRLAAAGWKHRTIWTFHDRNQGDGCIPRNPPAVDFSGVLYGGTQYGGSHNHGAVYQLKPPVPGSSAWSESVLWSFGGPREYYGPFTLLLGGDGALYGATQDTNNLGEVWRLSPPPGGAGAWTKTVLWQPSFDECEEPQSPGAIDAAGVLYGTCMGTGGQVNGTVYSLTPPAPGQTSWTPALIWSTGVAGEYLSQGPVLGPAGHLVVSTEAESVNQVVRLLPPVAGGTTWQARVLWNFSQSDGSMLGVPLNGVHNEVFGVAGGTASAQGDVWMLSPP